MLKEERFEVILKRLEKEENVSYEALAALLHVSQDTVRRDIDYLYRNGLLSKVRGGAMLRSKNPLSFNERTVTSTEQKNTIALKAQQLIRNGSTIFADGGTTICQMVGYFPANVQLRIVTNNPALIPIIATFPNIELILLGGKYDPEMAITTGVTTCSELNHYHAETYFMGACAVHPQFGALCTSTADAEVKRAMIKGSGKVVVLADQSKLRQLEPFKVADITQIDTLITDLNSEDEELDDFRGIGLQVL